MNFSCYTIPLHPEVQDLSGTETAKLSAILSAPQVQKEEDVAIQEESAIVEQPKKEVDQPKNWINRYTIGFAFIILVILWLIGESKRSFWRGMTYTVNQHGNLVGSYTGDASWLDAFHPAEIVASISYGINELLPIVLMVGVGLFIIMFLLSVSAETNKETNSDPDTKSITKEDILPQILGLFPHESTYSSSLPSEWLGKNRLKPSLFDTKTIEESFFPNTKNLFRSFGSTPVDDFVYIQAPRYSICSGETMRVIRKSSKRGNTYTRTYYQTFQLSLR